MSKKGIAQSLSRAGFSAVEMVVTLAIIVTITAVVLVDYSDFYNNAGLNLAVEKLIVTLREAQVYGIAVREEEVSDTFPSYGIYFDEATPDRVVMFADLDANNVYDAPGELVTTHLIPKPYTISDICIQRSLLDCSYTEMHVAYTRPDPKATITDASGTTESHFQVNLLAPGGDVRTVHISQWGYIRRL